MASPRGHKCGDCLQGNPADGSQLRSSRISHTMKRTLLLTTLAILPALADARDMEKAEEAGRKHAKKQGNTKDE